MGGSSKKQTVGFKYLFGVHMGIGRGPLDAIHEIRVADKRAWLGEVTDNTTIQVDAQELFGGEDKEGGVQGPLEVMLGDSTQEASTGLKAMLGSVLPGFRGVATLFYNGLVAVNNPYPKAWKFRVNRVLKGWDGDVWYPAKARIPIGSDDEEIDYTADLLIRYDAAQSRWENAVNGNELGTYDATSAQDYITTSTLDEVTSPPLAGLTVGRLNNLLRNSRSFVENGNFSTACWPSPVYPNNTGDMTFEVMVYLESAAPRRGGWLFNYGGIGHAWATPTNYESHRTQGIFSCWVTESGTLSFSVGVGADYSGTYPRLVIQTSSVIPLDSWTHLAFVRVGSEWTIYANGNLVATGSEATPMSGSGYFLIGGIFNQASPNWSGQAAGFVGYIAETRLIKTKGIYRKPFNPPALPLPVAGVQGGSDAYSMNAAHIIYECLTNRVWGRGLAPSKIDADSFVAAADTLHGESFGLCLKWTRKDSIENFIQGVIDHIGATLYVSRTTKLYTIKLIRGGYSLDDLPLFDTESGILSISDASVSSIGSTVNAVQVKYHDWRNDEERTVSVKNSAAIAAAGGVVNQVTRDFPGLPNAALALRVAQRELRAVSTALRKFTITMDRRGEDFAPGDVLAIQDAKRGIPKMAVRVGRVEDGTLLDGKITLTVVQDVFTLPATAMAADVPSSWVPPNTRPCIDNQRVIEAPYFLMVRNLTKADLDYVGSDSGYIATLNSRGQPLNQGYKIAVRPDAPTLDDNPPDSNYICDV